MSKIWSSIEFLITTKLWVLRRLGCTVIFIFGLEVFLVPNAMTGHPGYHISKLLSPCDLTDCLGVKYFLGGSKIIDGLSMFASTRIN